MAFSVLRDAKPDKDQVNQAVRRRLCWSQPSPEPQQGCHRGGTFKGQTKKHRDKQQSTKLNNSTEIKVGEILGDPVGSGGVRAHSRGLVVVTLVEGLGGPVPARL